MLTFITPCCLYCTATVNSKIMQLRVLSSVKFYYVNYCFKSQLITLGSDISVLNPLWMWWTSIQQLYEAVLYIKAVKLYYFWSTYVVYKFICWFPNIPNDDLSVVLFCFMLLSLNIQTFWIVTASKCKKCIKRSQS
jgi:hypothetical protein